MSCLIIGAGVLWTSQGAYYAINAKECMPLYLEERDSLGGDKNINAIALSNFASIFASSYLLLETAFKMLATSIYLADREDQSWKAAVFGCYTAIALVSCIAFSKLVRNFNDGKLDLFNNSADSYSSSQEQEEQEEQEEQHEQQGQQRQIAQSEWKIAEQDVLAVYQALIESPKLRMFLPYQVRRTLVFTC